MSYTALWKVTDDLWMVLQTILPLEKPVGTPGRPCIPFRQVFNGILYVLRSGCQWKAVPREFGSGSTVHRRFQEWVSQGVFQQAWQVLLERYDELVGIDWEWQAVDTKMFPAPLGGQETGPNPTDRGKSGTKRHLLVDRRGIPLSLLLTGANRHDKWGLGFLIRHVVADRPKPSDQHPQHMCLDKGYDMPECDQTLLDYGYLEHIKRKGQIECPVPGEKRYPVRRWVVERTLSWQNCHRKIRVRWEKLAAHYYALIALAACLTLYHRIRVLG